MRIRTLAIILVLDFCYLIGQNPACEFRTLAFLFQNFLSRLTWSLQKYQELRMVMPKTLPGQGRSLDWAGCSRWKALGLGRPHVLLATNLLGTLCRYFSCSPGSPPTFTKPPQTQ